MREFQLLLINCCLFIYVLFKGAAFGLDCGLVTSNDMMIMNWKIHGRKWWSSPNLRYYPGIYLQRLKKPTKILSYFSWVLNPEVHEDVVGVLTTRHDGVFHYCKKNNIINPTDTWSHRNSWAGLDILFRLEQLPARDAVNRSMFRKLTYKVNRSCCLVQFGGKVNYCLRY